jgi:hypothetical protein
MPSLAVAPPAYYDTCERTLRSKPRMACPKEVDPAWLGIAKSQFLTQNLAIEALQAGITDLSLLQDNWNGYGSPRPSTAAINAARSIVRRFQSLTVVPEKVMGSADGGVALVFVGFDRRRAVIESFGTHDDYVLLYDTEGYSHFVQWPEADAAKDEVLSELQSYLRGSQVAPLG